MAKSVARILVVIAAITVCLGLVATFGLLGG